MKIKKYLYYVGDFETTVFDGQDYTEVWASGVCPLWTEDAQIFGSIDETFDYLATLKENVCIYYHNLKFDGSFWLDFLLRKKGFSQALNVVGETSWFDKDKFMRNNTFKYSISVFGQWYNIIIKVNNKFIEIRDSLKLLPFSVEQIGKDFRTKHRKLEMEYKGVRWAGCEITPEERQYLKNDLYVIKEALEIMFEEGHNKLTIGSCCLAEFKKIYSEFEYNKLFPNLYEFMLPSGISAGEFVHRSYKGGWCYLNPSKRKKVISNGLTLDVNSLYPSVMHSESGNPYPIGLPNYWSGNYVPDLPENKYFFIHFKCRFRIKKGKLPFIQIKNNLLYKGNEMLTTSDVWSSKLERYSRFYTEKGEIKDSIVELTMTQTDWILFNEHYEIEDLEIIDGVYFDSMIGLFDEYINHYKEIKLKSTGAQRTLAKLFLNNLYGKMASSPDSSFKIVFIDEHNKLAFKDVKESKKKPGYIAIGSAVTSYARNFTIRAAQMNYYGDEPGFIYSDTDSIHLDLPKDRLKGVTIDNVNFNCWKIESEWEKGWFVRQKTYIEIENGKIDIKCAGMPSRAKDIFIHALEKKDPENEIEREFQEIKTWGLEDFKEGLIVPGKLLPTRIKGGIVLKEGFYTLR